MNNRKPEMANKKDNKKIKKETLQQIKDFYFSDTLPANAAKFILASIAIGGIAFTGAAAPGVFFATRNLNKSKYSKKQIRNAVYNLKKRKLIEFIQENDGVIKAELTNKGTKRVKDFCFEDMKIKKPKKWDKKWRIITFDIPSKPKAYNQAREAFRGKIKDLGFYQIQKSVWAYPYECEDELLFLAELFNIQKYIEIITAEKILHENYLKNKFGLK